MTDANARRLRAEQVIQTSTETNDRAQARIGRSAVQMAETIIRVLESQAELADPPTDVVGFAALALVRGARTEELDRLLAAVQSQPYPTRAGDAVAQVDQALRTLRRRD
jgi:hypothetical protein